MSLMAEQYLKNALDVARRSGGVEGDHHRAWTIDQMVRALTGCPMLEEGRVDADKPTTAAYRDWVAETKAGDEGPDTWDWDTGIAP